jgi:hypothetical protein
MTPQRRRSNESETTGESTASTASARRGDAKVSRPSGDDALRLAVETLSAEICWFVANDAGARRVFAAATTPSSTRPTP